MTNRIALVTGGMGGLGEAISVKLHDAGYRVVVTHSPDNAGAKDWLARMKETDREFHAYSMDVADYDSCQRGASKIQSEIGPVDILVNNAGITRDMTFRKLDKVNWTPCCARISTRSSTSRSRCATAWSNARGAASSISLR